MIFDEPLGGRFTYISWDVDLRLSGAFVRSSGRRGAQKRNLARLAASLTGRPEVHSAQVLEVTVIPPITGGPRYDLALLVRADAALDEFIAAEALTLGLPAPSLSLTARNSGKFGDTDARPGEILLNHFAGTATPHEAVDAWKSVSQWYMDVLGVDNSTLLEFDPGAPFLIMNYARIPGKVIPFLAGQLARPSFYRVVRGRLHDARITPFPLFARKVGA